MKVILLSLAHSFGLVIKASLFSHNPLFNIYLKYSKTEASISVFLHFLGPENNYLSDMKSVLFLYFINDIHMPHNILSTSCMITYLFSAQDNV